LWLIAKATLVVTQREWPFVKRLRERLVVRASGSGHPLARAVLPLLDPARREPMTLLVSAVLLVAGAWLFLGVVEDVVTKDVLIDVDRAVYRFLQALRSRWGDDVMVTITELAGAQSMIAVIAAVALWFAVTRRFHTLAYWLAAAGFAQVLVWSLKYALGRARPETAYARIDEFSLPSGHAAMSMVVFGFLAFLLGHGKPASRQTAFAVTAALIAVLVAFSRIYLGAHWLSDVIASFGLGLAWIALLGIAYTEHVHEGTIRATPTLLIVCVTLLLVGGTYASMHHERDVARYATTATVRTLPIGEWRDGGWQGLPTARTEMAGGPEEPFSVQWAATRDTISDTLAKAGWARPAPWISSATLLWLLPSTPIAALPVLPRFDQGQPPALTRIRPIDARTRLVMRLWRVAEAADDTSPALRVPIWTGMITREHSRPEWHVIAATRTDAEFPPAAHVLRDAIAGQRNAVATLPASGEPVLLVW
jgi:membrane-associated phospholipid phosphatase